MLIFQLFLRSSDGSNDGHWAIVDCHPDDIACGGGSHRLLISPKTNADATCVDGLPAKGWLYCSGELASNGICTEYAYDDTIGFTCS